MTIRSRNYGLVSNNGRAANMCSMASLFFTQIWERPRRRFTLDTGNVEYVSSSVTQAGIRSSRVSSQRSILCSADKHFLRMELNSRVPEGRHHQRKLPSNSVVRMHLASVWPSRQKSQFFSPQAWWHDPQGPASLSIGETRSMVRMPRKS